MTDKKISIPPQQQPQPQHKDVGTAICTEDHSSNKTTNIPFVTRNFAPTPAPPAPSRPGRGDKKD